MKLQLTVVNIDTQKKNCIIPFEIISNYLFIYHTFFFITHLPHSNIVKSNIKCQKVKCLYWMDNTLALSTDQSLKQVVLPMTKMRIKVYFNAH